MTVVRAVSESVYVGDVVWTQRVRVSAGPGADLQSPRYIAHVHELRNCFNNGHAERSRGMTFCFYLFPETLSQLLT